MVDYALVWIKFWEFVLHVWVLWKLRRQGWDSSYLIVDIFMEDSNLVSLQLLEKIKHLWDVIYQICFRHGSLIHAYFSVVWNSRYRQREFSSHVCVTVVSPKILLDWQSVNSGAEYVMDHSK